MREPSSRTLLLAIAAACLLAVGAVGPCRVSPVVLVAYPETVAQWDRFEVAAAFDTGDANPFDPAEVDARVELIDPHGAGLEAPAFLTREYTAELVGGFEKRSPASEMYWLMRFTPNSQGSWQWRWRVTTRDGTESTPWRSVDVTAPRADRHGFLRVSPDDSRYLRFDDGSGYFAIGENMAWYGGGGSFDYEAWLDRLASEGGNYIRLWMPSWAFGIEWGALGRYDNRLDRAWQLDRVIEAAAERGISVMLNVQNHGPFSTSNSEWPGNPYNAANGGPLQAPADFITDETARALFKRRLRYVVARWGYATNLLAWELWNEFNLVFTAGAAPISDWHVEMAQELARLDPADHLVTTSTSGTAVTGVWDLPEIDLTQTHAYAFPFFYDYGDFLPQLFSFAEREGKPHLLGEVGTDFRGPAETLAGDPEAIGFHDALWVGVLAETFGTGMTWWWDNLIDPQDLYFHFGPIARFVEGIAFDRQGFTASLPEVSASERNLRAMALVGSSVALVWIKDVEYQWFPLEPAGAPTLVENATLRIVGLGEDHWRVRYLDTRTGLDLGQLDVTPSAGEVLLEVPLFAADVAVRMERLERLD